MSPDFKPEGTVIQGMCIEYRQAIRTTGWKIYRRHIQTIVEIHFHST
jgi:hypothetical protein